jgi:hypothetical protein
MLAFVSVIDNALLGAYFTFDCRKLRAVFVPESEFVEPWVFPDAN